MIQKNYYLDKCSLLLQYLLFDNNVKRHCFVIHLFQEIAQTAPYRTYSLKIGVELKLIVDSQNNIQRMKFYTNKPFILGDLTHHNLQANLGRSLLVPCDTLGVQVPQSAQLNQIYKPINPTKVP